MHVSRLNRLGRVLGRASGLATLLVLVAGDALAQGAAGPVLKPLTQYHLESWQTRDGLPTNGIRALAQDADGFLWLGTEAGLVRFDGVEFRTFDRNSTPALKANDVTALFVDNVNRLWIGTDDGAVLRRRDGVFEEFSQVRLSGPISAFYQDQRGVIWVAGGDSVGRVSENALVLMRGAVDTIASIYEDANGALTLGTYGPLGRIEDDTIRPDAEGPEDVQAALRQADGTLWQALPTRPAAHRRRASGPALHDRRRPAVAGRQGAEARSSRRPVDRDDRRRGAPGRRPPRRAHRGPRRGLRGAVRDGAARGSRGQHLGGHAPRRPAPAARRAVPRHHPARRTGPRRRPRRSSRITPRTCGSAPTAPG